VTLDYPPEGGHVGFYERNLGLAWLPQRVFRFLLQGT
jgi:predicted alpha/beta-fold hydrolase